MKRTRIADMSMEQVIEKALSYKGISGHNELHRRMAFFLKDYDKCFREMTIAAIHRNDRSASLIRELRESTAKLSALETKANTSILFGIHVLKNAVRHHISKIFWGM